MSWDRDWSGSNGAMDHWIINYWTEGAMDQWIFGSQSDSWERDGSMDRWIDGSLDHWIIGSLDHWIIGKEIGLGALERWIIGALMIFWTEGAMDRWIIGSQPIPCDRGSDGALDHWIIALFLGQILVMDR